MKKFVKIMLIIAAVFTVLGICFCVAGASMGATMEGVEVVRQFKARFGDRFSDYFYAEYDDDKWEDDWKEYLDPQKDDGKGSRSYTRPTAKKLELNLRYDDVYFKAGSGNEILVEVANDPENNVRIHSETDEIEIRSIKHKNNRKITVSVPDKTRFDELEIDLDAGAITIDQDLFAANLGISVGAGEMNANSVLSAKEAEIEVGAGSVAIFKLDAQSVKGECGLGEMNITLKGKKEDYNCHVECGVGSLNVGQEDFSGFSGEHSLNHNGATRTLELECGMGELNADFDGEKL